MKKFLRNHGLWVLFAGAVIAVALAVVSVFSNSSSPLTNLVQTVTSPFRSAYTATALWFNEKQNYFKDVTALEKENKALKQQIARMEDQIRRAENASSENERLHDLLNLQEQRPDLTSDLEAAFITEHTVSNWASSLTLNKGSNHGLELNDPVINEMGSLVGFIGELGTNWAKVYTIVDTDTSLGAQVFRTKDLCLAQGNFSLLQQNRLRLNYLPSDCQLLNGDLVITSGLGGYYPAGLVIGSIQDVQLDAAGTASYAIVEPETDFDNLDEVFVIKSFDMGN